MTDERLERIEDKMDKMHIAIVAMARMEEPMITFFKRLDTFEQSAKKIDERMDAMRSYDFVYNVSGAAR